MPINKKFAKPFRATLEIKITNVSVYGLKNMVKGISFNPNEKKRSN